MVHAWQLGHSFGRPAALAGRRARCCCPPVSAAAAPSTELGKESRIGKQPIPIPKGATYSFDGSNFKVKVQPVESNGLCVDGLPCLIHNSALCRGPKARCKSLLTAA